VSEIHSYPVGDLIEHYTEDDDGCACGPDVEYVEGGGKVVKHHSLDGREAGEGPFRPAPDLRCATDG
jgi:hypothetical protein